MIDSGKYIFDAAIIEVPWSDWMQDIPEIHFGEAKISAQVKLMGFPKSTDSEATPTDWTRGRMSLSAEIPTSADNDKEKAFKSATPAQTPTPLNETI